jgi:hypothetical protein
MATNLNTIAKQLEHRQWQYEIDHQSQTVITGVRTNCIAKFLIFIRLKESGDYVQFLAPQLCHLKGNVFKGIAYQTLLHISYSEPLIRFATDPQDGEVCASVELPLEDANLTQRQFDRCLDELIHLVDMETMPRLNQVLATGNDTGKVDSVDYLYQATMGDRVGVSFDFRRSAEMLLTRATPDDLAWLVGQIQQRR